MGNVTVVPVTPQHNAFTETHHLDFFYFLLLLQILINEQTNKQQNKAWEEGHSHKLARLHEAAEAPALGCSSPCLLLWPHRRTDKQPGRQTGRRTGSHRCSESRAMCPPLLAGQGGTGRRKDFRGSAECLVPLAAGTDSCHAQQAGRAPLTPITASAAFLQGPLL